MQVTLLSIHLVLAIALVAVVLLQRSEGGALGIGGGGGGGLVSARGAANLLTRATSWLAAAFIGTSLTLAIMAGQGQEGSTVLDEAEAQQQQQEQGEDGPSVPVPDDG